jgi:hypothetical protein
MRISIEIPASALTAYVPDSLNTECPKDELPTDQAQDWKLAAGGRIVVRRGRPWVSTRHLAVARTRLTTNVSTLSTPSDSGSMNRFGERITEWGGGKKHEQTAVELAAIVYWVPGCHNARLGGPFSLILSY